MHAFALMALMSASTVGECRADDCGRCYGPHSHSVCRDFEEFFCNISKPCDFRLRGNWWPMEYPGARGRGWMAEGTAVTRFTPINVGPEAVQVVMDENGIPKALRPPAPKPTSSVQPITPAEPPGGFFRSGRHHSDVTAQSRYRFVE